MTMNVKVLQKLLSYSFELNVLVKWTNMAELQNKMKESKHNLSNNQLIYDPKIKKEFRTQIFVKFNEKCFWGVWKFLK